MRKKKLRKIEGSKGQVVLYKNKLEVRFVNESVWLTQDQIGRLFGTKRPAITKHLANIFKSSELSKNSVCSISEHTATDGKVYQAQYYNLDAIISVGYRVNSSRATQFRIWATGIVHKHLVNGYTINEKRLKVAEHKYQELQNSIKLLGNVVMLEEISDKTKGLINVVSMYSRALELLDDYDNQRLTVPKGTMRLKYELTYENAKSIIAQIKQIIKNSGFFGQEKDQSFKSSLGAIYQSFGGKDLYPTVEEKAGYLL